MMINILSIRCSLVFAPYLSLAAAEYLTGGAITSRVVRQGGTSLILRSDGDLVLRHEHRQVSLGTEEVRHYAATIQLRIEHFDVSRMQDEVVLASVGNELLLSHPQSQVWLTREAVGALACLFNNEANAAFQERSASVPEWLKVSIGGGRLLLSDQRTGRWVLLGEDHARELERRAGGLCPTGPAAAHQAPPSIPLKGLTIHLQSAFNLAVTLGEFASTGNVRPYEEITPNYLLKVSASTEGIELRDLNSRVALTAREARKWAPLLDDELKRLNAHQFERGGIRTVFATGDGGCWVLQWGDEVFVPSGVGKRSREMPADEAPVIAQRAGEFLLLLDLATAACVALTDSESSWLDELQESV